MIIRNTALLAASVLISSQVMALDSSIRPTQINAAEKISAQATLPVGGPSVLVIQDVAPWGSDANETILDSLGVPYQVISSSDLATLVLEDVAYIHTIIVSSDQDQAFYDTLAGYMPQIEQWVRIGSNTLLFHGSDYGWQGSTWNFSLPKGVTHETPVYDRQNYVLDDTSSLVTGVAAVVDGNYASHGILVMGEEDLSANVVMTNTGGSATLMDYCYGRGRIIASTMTYEFSYTNEYTDIGQLLVNTITEGATDPGCPSNPLKNR